MNITPATSNSWQINPMPPESKVFTLALTLSAEEYQQIQVGHIPEDMDDKWFIYFENGWLNLHRSWTGNCTYRLRFEPTEAGYQVVEAWVNRNPNQYKETDDKYDSQLVVFLVNRILLGKDYPFPHREETR